MHVRYRDGYNTICNIDISSVVISQQQEVSPEMQWMVMDALNTTFHDESFPYILDKSLIDTVLCYKNSVVATFSLIQEMYRVLAPGGTYVTFSLHAEEEILDYFTFDEFQWAISTFKILNPRWTSEAQSCRRSVSHSMIVCHKPFKDGCYPISLPLSLTNVLSDDEYQKLKACAENVCPVSSLAFNYFLNFLYQIHFSCAVRDASSDFLLSCLDKVLNLFSNTSEKGQQAS